MGSCCDGWGSVLCGPLVAMEERKRCSVDIPIPGCHGLRVLLRRSLSDLRPSPGGWVKHALWPQNVLSKTQEIIGIGGNRLHTTTGEDSGDRGKDGTLSALQGISNQKGGSLKDPVPFYCPNRLVISPTPLNRAQQCLCIVLCLSLDLAPPTQPTPRSQSGIGLWGLSYTSHLAPPPMEIQLLSSLSWRLSELPCSDPRTLGSWTLSPQHSLPAGRQTQPNLGPFKCLERAWPWGQFFTQHLINQSPLAVSYLPFLKVLTICLALC